MRQCWSLVALLKLFLMVQCGSGAAADMKPEKVPDSALHLVRITGEFEKSDYPKFMRAVAKLPLLFVVVLFNSPGGDLDSALSIGEEIKHRGFSTAVEAGAICASACALAWLAGDTRYMEPSSKIGFHAAYVREGQKAVEKGEGNALVGAYLERLGLSSDAIRYITRASPSDVQWLSIRHSMMLGINVTIPSQIRSSQ